MTPLLRDVLQHPLTEALGWTLAHSLWQITAIAALLALVLLVFRRRGAQARYVAACAALLLCILSAGATYAMLFAEMAQRQSPQLGASSAEPRPVPISVPLEITPIDLATDPQPATTLQHRIESLLPGAVVLWLIGVAALSIWNLLGWLRVQRLRRRARPLDNANWADVLSRLCAKLRVGRDVRLALSEQVDVPSVIGCFRSIILVPPCALTGLPPQQLEALLAHELAHVRRWDYLINLIQTALETLLFYHPAVWWMSRVIRQEREHCCDDLAAAACGDRRRYAHALARMEELRLGPAPLALAANGASLLPRIRRLLDIKSDPRTSNRSLAATFLGIACVIAIPVLIQLSAKAEQSATPDPTTPTTAPADAPAAVPPGRTDPELQALLQQRIPEVSLQETPLADVIDFLRDVTGANIFVNWRALEGVGIDRNAPVTLRVRNVSLDKALRLVLDEVGGGTVQLAYGTDQNVITVSTEEDVARLREPPQLFATGEYYISGVERPGAYALERDITLRQALLAAGDQESMAGKYVIIVRFDPHRSAMRRVSIAIDDLLAKRIPDVHVHKDDVLMVTDNRAATQPAEHESFRIEGDVPQPGWYPLEGRSVTPLQALVAAGANPPDMQDKWVAMYRDGQLVYRAQVRSLSSGARVEAGDRIVVSDARPRDE